MQAQPLLAQLSDDNEGLGKSQTSWWLRKRTAMQALGFLGGASLATNVLPSLSLMGKGGDGGGNGDGGGGGGGGNGGHNPIFDLAEGAEGYHPLKCHELDTMLQGNGYHAFQ